MRFMIVTRPLVALACIAIAIAVMLNGREITGANGTFDWPLHNLDLHNSRYAPIDQINTSNVSTLTLKWTFQTEETGGIGAVTPIVIDGIMYFNGGSKLFAV